MQNNPGDMPKIIGLSVAIFVCLLVGIYLFHGLNSSATPGPAADTTAPGGAPAAGVQIASASGAAPASQAGAGMVRLLDPDPNPSTGLDVDPLPGQLPSIPAGRANAFQIIRAPLIAPLRISPANKMDYRSRPTEGPALPWNPILAQPSPGAQRVGADSRPTVSPSAALPALEIKLDGVVTGLDGFAVLTIRNLASKDAVTGEQTVFKRVGERIAGFKILGISELGVLLERRMQPWLVGQIMTIGQRPPVAPSTPGLPVGSGGESRTPVPGTDAPPTQTPSGSL